MSTDVIPIDPKHPPVDNGIFTIPSPNDPAWREGRRGWMLPYALVIISVTTAMVVLRLVTRINRTGRRVGLDDLLIIIAWILSVTMTGIICYGAINLGWDRHMMKVSPTIWPYGAKWTLIAEIIFMYSLLSTKISILMFYRRLIAGTYSKKFKWALWSGIAFAFITTVVFTGLLLRSCRPFPAIWLQWDIIWVYRNAYKFRCKPRAITRIVSQVAGACTVTSDFYSVLLPSLLLMRMRLNKRQRIGLFFVFGLGYITVIAGAVRIYYLSEATGPEPDKSWNVFSVWAASIAEANAGIMCACAPSLKSVFGKFFHPSKSNTKESSENKSKGLNGALRTNDKMGKFFDSRITDVSQSDTDKWTQSDSASSWVSKMPFSPMRKSAQFADQELTSFAETHERGDGSSATVPEGYDEVAGRDGSAGSTGDEIPLRPTVFRYDFAHEDLLATNLSSPPPIYADTRFLDPAIPLPTQIAPVKVKTSSGHDRASTPSVLFIDNQDGTETLRRVRYHSYVSSTDSQEERSSNKVVTRSQSLQNNALTSPAKEHSTGEQTHSVPSTFTFPAPQAWKATKPLPLPAASAGKGSVRQALLDLKAVTDDTAGSSLELSPRSLGFPQPREMPSFHRNNVSHISDPSEDGSSASSIAEDVTSDKQVIDVTKSTYDAAQHVPMLSPHGYPATRPVSPPELQDPLPTLEMRSETGSASAQPVLSPGGYPATRPVRTPSLKKPVNTVFAGNRAFITQPSISSGNLPPSTPTYGLLPSTGRGAAPVQFDSTTSTPPVQTSFRFDFPAGRSSPHTQAESLPPSTSGGIRKPRIRRVSSSEKRW